MGFIFRSKQVILPGFELSGLPAHRRAALMSGDIPPVVRVCFYSRRALGEFSVRYAPWLQLTRGPEMPRNAHNAAKAKTIKNAPPVQRLILS